MWNIRNSVHTKTKEHDLKEISRQEATDDKDGFILYACKRNGCDYQMKEVIPAKAASDPEDTDENKDGEEKDPEKENTVDSDTKNESKSEENSKDETKMMVSVAAIQRNFQTKISTKNMQVLHTRHLQK